MSDPVYDAAGAQLDAHVDNGADFIVTYGLPTAGIALGAGLVLALFVKFGKRIRGWLG